MPNTHAMPDTEWRGNSASKSSGGPKLGISSLGKSQYDSVKEKKSKNTAATVERRRGVVEPGESSGGQRRRSADHEGYPRDHGSREQSAKDQGSKKTGSKGHCIWKEMFPPLGNFDTLEPKPQKRLQAPGRTPREQMDKNRATRLYHRASR